MSKSTFKQKLVMVLGSIIVTSLILEIFLRCAGSIYLHIEENRNRILVKGKKLLTIVCIGESTTMLGGIDAYPRQLETLLNKDSEDLKFKVINKGIAAVDSAVILSKIDDIISTYHPDIVISMMGINDTGRTIVYNDSSRNKFTLFVQNLRIIKLIQLLKDHLSAKIFDITFSNVITALKHRSQLLPFELNLIDQIRMSPKSQDLYVELGHYYESTKRFLEAEKLYLYGIKKSPKKSWGYIELSRLYLETNRVELAKNLCEKVLNKYPNKVWAYQNMANVYLQLKDKDSAERILRQNISLNSDNNEAYANLANFYRGKGDCDQAIPLYDKAIKLNANNHESMSAKGFCLIELGHESEAQEIFKKATQVDLREYQTIVNFYLGRKEEKKAEEFLLNSLTNYQDAFHRKPILSELVVFYNLIGKKDVASPYIKELQENIGTEGYLETTITNYHNLIDKLQKNKVKLIAMQYPMRNVDPLRNILRNQPVSTFIDNESVFKDAVDKRGFSTIFVDSFAGDFGHCSKEGNQILAQNVAQVIRSSIPRLVE